MSSLACAPFKELLRFESPQLLLSQAPGSQRLRDDGKDGATL